MIARPLVKGFFELETKSVQYIVADPVTRKCAIIDPVLNFSPLSGRTTTSSANELLTYVREEKLTVEWILDTHPHADHFSAASYLKMKTGAPTATGEKIVEVQAVWKHLYNLDDSFRADGSQWDRLFADNDSFKIGQLEANVLLTPGHTLCSVAYIVGDAAFIHDTLFMPDVGSARADFPGGNADVLWNSIQRIMQLPPTTRLFTGHDYCPGNRKHPAWESTVEEQRCKNIHLKAAQNKQEFVNIRRARDQTLPLPRLMLHALQVNIAAGELPAAEDNGISYLRIPVNSMDNIV